MAAHSLAARWADCRHYPSTDVSTSLLCGQSILTVNYRVGSLGAGAATNTSASGWRTIFWIQAGMFAATALGLLVFYHPKKDHNLHEITWKKIIWECDPIGSVLFIISCTLMLLALDWAGGSYPWHSVQVVAPLTTGLVSAVLFALYGRHLYISCPGIGRYLANHEIRMERKR